MQTPADLVDHATPILLFGTGELPKTIAAYLNHGSEGTLAVAGFTCDRPFMPEDNRFLDRPVVPFERDAIDAFQSSLQSPEGLKLLLPVGYRDCNRLRERKYIQAKEWGFQFATYVHPSVQLFPDVTIGENSIVLDHVSIQSGVETGHSCILWPFTILGHGTTIGSCCWLSGGTIVGGQCLIGDRVFMGANSAARDRITIGDDCVIGIGATITKATTPGAVYLAGVNRRFFRKSDKVVI